MAKTRRRVLSILMALVLTLGLLPTAALAHSGNTTIKVVDAQTDAPIQNAKVTVEHRFYGSGSTYTDPNGIAPFNLTLAYADYSVSVSAAGYQPGSGSVNAYQTKVIRLTPDGSGGQATNGSDAYFYILKPNLTSGSYIPDATDDEYVNLWDYVGKGKLKDSYGDPQYGKSEHTYTYDANEVETFPTMPSISYNGKTYTYEQSGMRANTYQVTWVRFVDANGWNDGEKKYDSGKPTWHVDGYVTFCDVNSYQVTYTVIGENDGFPVHTEVVNSGVYAQGYTYTGYDTSRYEFKGWYTDKACTQAYDFQAPVTKNLNLYGKLVEKTHTPSVAPTATLTLTKKWDNVASGTDTINISVGSVSKSVTVGQETELTFEGLTPNQQYTITETPDNYLLDKNTITLNSDLLTGMTFSAIERYESCNNLTTEDLDGANAIVAALTGHQNDGYVVWTYQELSDNEKAAFVKAFLEANIKGPYNQITVGNTKFISGPNASYGARDVIVNAANGTLTFGATKVWAQFVTGTYGYLYGGEGATVTNSPKVGSLTINKTFSYEGTTNTSAPAGFGATFVVKNESGTPVASLTYADLSDLTKNPITNLPYGTYTVEETNITGTLAPAYNPNPTVSYDDGTTGEGKTDNQIALNAPTATMKVNNHYSLTNSPIVGITKTATPTATAGDTITYTITVTNTGGGMATYVVVTDTLPDGLVKENEDVTLNCPEGTDYSYDPQTGTVTWTIPSLAAQTGKAELTVKVKVADSALSMEKITNTAYMKTYDEYQGDPIPAHAETKITKSNLSIAKRASSTSDETGATAKPGDTITYTITVKNTGDAAATGKTVIDTLPSAGLQNINADTGTYNKDQNTITWRDLTIPAGETVTLTVTAIVAPLTNTSQGITLVNNVAMDDLSDSVTTRVGATTATLTIEKYVTGLPAADTAAWNALVNAVSFTVTGQPESGETFTPVTVDLDEFQSTVSGVYTYSLENLAPGTYTVTENGYDVLSTYGYTWNAENSAASVKKTVTAGVPASAAIRNAYDSREFTIIFDSNTNGVLLNRDRSTVVMGDSFRYGWIVPTGNETVSTGPNWAGALLVGQTFNGSPNSQVSYTFTKAEYLEYGNHNTYSMAFSQPGVTANNGYNFTGSFTTTGAAEGMKFESLAATMAYLLASDQDQITYYANYTSGGQPVDPGPIEPGPNPDPIEPGPIDPGPSDPGTNIPDEGTPTTNLPEEETPTTELPDEETPMTEEPVEELPEEEVPMAEVPATGDAAGLWALAAGVSGLALVWLALSGKKRREENA